MLGNIFSIFPVSGMFSKNAENLRFRLYNPITIYSIIIQFCFLVEIVLLLLFLSKTGLTFDLAGELTRDDRVHLEEISNQFRFISTP